MYISIGLYGYLVHWPQRGCPSIHFVTLATNVDQSGVGNTYIYIYIYCIHIALYVFIYPSIGVSNYTHIFLSVYLAVCQSISLATTALRGLSLCDARDEGWWWSFLSIYIYIYIYVCASCLYVYLVNWRQRLCASIHFVTRATFLTSPVSVIYIINLSIYLCICLYVYLVNWPQRLCAAIHFVTLATNVDQSGHGNIYIIYISISLYIFPSIHRYVYLILLMCFYLYIY